MSEYDWEERITIELSRAAVVTLGGKLSVSCFQNEYKEFSEWGKAAEEAIDELCCALEMDSVLDPKSQSDPEFWGKAEKALLRRIG